MLVQPECLACFVRQAVDAAMVASDRPAIHREAALRACRLVADSSPDVTPVALAQQVHELVQELTGAADTYADLRRRLNEQALALWPLLTRVIEEAEDWVETGARVAIAGNIMDLGVTSYEQLRDAETELRRCLDQPFAREDLAELRGMLDGAGLVLYIGDNAGEIVFDKAFIGRMRQAVGRMVFAVRGGPVINDVTLTDAEQVAMGEVAEVVTTGFAGPGVELDLCSEELRGLFHEADVVIAKGQGNFESLSGTPGPVFLLLQAKCRAIARHIGVPVGGLVAVRAART